MIRITRHNGILDATIPLPSSKSISNRALVLRFLSGSDTVLRNLSDAGDTVQLQKLLSGRPAGMDAGDAGTAFRFLTAALSVTPGTWRLFGTPRLMQRPISGLVDALRRLGADIRYELREGYAPLIIHGGALRGGHVTLDAGTSSQFASALVMIAPLLRDGLRLTLSGKSVSRPYLDMTLHLLERFGIRTLVDGDDIAIPFQAFATPREFEIEPDWSAASYWFEAAALSEQARIRLPGLRDSGLQGDAAIVRIMQPLGVACTPGPDGYLLEKSTATEFRGCLEADFQDTPDLAPAVVATAAGLGLKARFSGLGTLNLKESQRKDVLETELKRNGLQVRPGAETLELSGGKLVRQPSFHTHHDHRMVMAFAMLSLRAAHVDLDDADAVGKSYPSFWKAMQSAGFTPALLPEESSREEVS